MYTTKNFKTKKELKEAVARYNDVARMNEQRKKFAQDGGTFYDMQTNMRVAEYKHLVKNDFDLDGAKQARHEFLKEHPAYREVLYEENNASPVTIFAPGLGTPVSNGWDTVEGPHAPQPHKWYARVRLVDGVVVEVK